MGYKATEMHSNRTLNQRREALDGFKSGRYKVLVATDIAARGIDVTGIELVINYDLPEDAENYVHRIGRTARAGKHGHAISFATPDQSRDVRDIEKIIRSTLPVSKHPEIPPEEFIESGRGGTTQARPRWHKASGHQGGHQGGRKNDFRHEKSKNKKFYR
ncbi:MAG: helicase-related protein [Candidatus Omnitrophica bacterium]|nr:helicase-related protein [Candidatus Omnitrophota bacterium]